MAQYTRAEVITYITAQIVENTTGAITATKLNAVLDYMVDRIYNPSEIPVDKSGSGYSSTDLDSLLSEIISEINSIVVPDELTDLDTTVTGSQLNAIKTKIDLIEDGATADQTGTEIVSLLEALVGAAQLDGAYVYHTTSGASVSQAIDGAQSAADAAQSDIDTHIADTSNPHSVTAEQVTYDIGGSENVGAALDDVYDELDLRALKSNVLEKNNTTSFTPSADYHPATKKYVDDQVILAGAGDMTKAVYDTDDDGIVNMADKLDDGSTGKSYSDIQGEIPTALSELSDDSNHRVVTDIEKSAWNNKQAKPSEGAFVDGDKTKLDGIETGATADQSDAEIETAYNNQVAQVSAGEKTAGTATGIRRFSPKDVADMALTHGGGGTITPTEVDLDGLSSLTPDLTSQTWYIYENAAGPVTVNNFTNYASLDGVEVVIVIKPAYYQEAVLTFEDLYRIDDFTLKFDEALEIKINFEDGNPVVNSTVIKTMNEPPFKPQLIVTKNIDQINNPVGIQITNVDTSGANDIYTLSWLPYFDDFINVRSGREWMLIKGTGSDATNGGDSDPRDAQAFRYGRIVAVDYANKTVEIDSDVAYGAPTPGVFAVDDYIGFINPSGGEWHYLNGGSSLIIDASQCDYASSMVTIGGIWKHSDGTWRAAVNGHNGSNWQIGIFKSTDLINWTQATAGAQIVYSGSTTYSCNWFNTGVQVFSVIKEGSTVYAFCIGWGGTHNGNAEIGVISFDEDMGSISVASSYLLDNTVAPLGLYEPNCIKFEDEYHLTVGYRDNTGTDTLTDYKITHYKSSSIDSGYSLVGDFLPASYQNTNQYSFANSHSTETAKFIHDGKMYALFCGTSKYNKACNRGSRMIGLAEWNGTSWDAKPFGACFSTIWTTSFGLSADAVGHMGGAPVFFRDDINDVDYFFTAVTVSTNDYEAVLYSRSATENFDDPSKVMTLNASAFNARSTNGATYGIEETSTNKVNIAYFAFDDTTQQYIQAEFENDGSFLTNKIMAKLQLRTDVDAASTNSVAFTVQGVVINPGDEIDAAFGTAQQVNVILADASKNVDSGWTGDITLGGSKIAGNSKIIIQISRKTGDTTYDTLAELAKMISCKIYKISPDE